MDQFSCSNCFNSDPEKLDVLFKEKSDEGRKSLLIMILTVALNIEKMFQYYCFCHDKMQCAICAASEKFKGAHYLFYQNSLNFNKDNKIVADLLKVLKEISFRNNHFVCGLINHKYYYTSQNWFSGKKSSFFC